MSSLPAVGYEQHLTRITGIACYESHILMAEASLVELRGCSNIERRKELQAKVQTTMRRLENDEVADHLSFIVAGGVQPAHETLNETCPYKNLKQNTALIQQVKLQGYGICPHCARVIVLAPTARLTALKGNRRKQAMPGLIEPRFGTPGGAKKI
jgi:RNA polymerase-binding transcription factor DksA